MESVAKVQTALLDNNCRIFNLKKSVREDKIPLDLAIAIGGDGTFLRAAGWLLNRNLPLIGFNSDPGYGFIFKDIILAHFFLFVFYYH